VHALQKREVAILFDVGANTGQFAAQLRQFGYRDRIVSFEPLRDCHAALSTRAQGDREWIVAPRAALGGTPGECEINVSANRAASSLLRPTERLEHAAPQARIVGVEKVRVMRLDDYLDETGCDTKMPLGLKLDVQGFESSVLDGAERRLGQIRAIYL